MDHQDIRMSTKEADRLGIIKQVDRKQLTQVDAAVQLNVTDRQIRRLVRRYRHTGTRGLVHGNRGRVSNRRLPEDRRRRLTTLLESRYRDFNNTHAAEQLARREGITVGRETIRQLRIAAGLHRPKTRKPTHRQWRERRAHVGELVQFDGSHHDWLEGRGPKLVLLSAVDDATSRPVAAFYPAEDQASVFTFWEDYLNTYGRPVALYLDRHTIYRSPDPEALTQFGRALETLGIRLVWAYSPQAKGRVERSFRTQQDRLVKELRLERVSSMGEANRYLQEVFLPDSVRRFSVPPQSATNLHRPLPAGTSLPAILCPHYRRVVRNDFTVSFQNKLLQLSPVQPVTVLPKDTVTVEERREGPLVLTRRGRVLSYREVAHRPTPNPRQWVATSVQPKPRGVTRPAPDHPWRRQPLSTPARP